jgi:hypothetical protein
MLCLKLLLKLDELEGENIEVQGFEKTYQLFQHPLIQKYNPSTATWANFLY